MKRKTNKSYDKTAVRNDTGNNAKKIVNLILENAMPKAIIEVYFELLVTNFYAQISCSCHSEFVKTLTVFVYISFPASTKIFWLVTYPTTQDKNNGPAQFRTTTANSSSINVFSLRMSVYVMLEPVK